MKSSRKFHQGTQSTTSKLFMNVFRNPQRKSHGRRRFFFRMAQEKRASQLAQSLLFEITQVFAKVVENLCDFIQRHYGCQGHEGLEGALYEEPWVSNEKCENQHQLCALLHGFVKAHEASVDGLRSRSFFRCFSSFLQLGW